MRQEYAIGDKLAEYSKFAPLNNHAVQLSFERSGRVWLASIMDHVMHEKTHTYTHSLEEKDPARLYSGVYINTHLHNGLEFFDNAKYILLIRDPRDSMRSWIGMAIRHEVRGDDLWNDYETISWLCDEWRAYFTSGVLDKDTLVVQYENLCLRPRAAVWKIIDHIGWIEPIRSIDDVMCLWYDRVRDFPAPDIGYYNAHCLKWKRVFTGGQPDFIFGNLQDIMLKYGYTENGHDLGVINETVI